MSRERRRGSGSWRDGQRRRSRKPQGTRSLRWIFTLIAAALVIAFLVALYNPFRKERRLFAIPVWTNDQLAVPPGAYLREDIDALSLVPDVDFHAALAMQTAEEFQRLGVELKREVSARTDLVTLYIAAHGISQGGEPYLICSKFNRSRGAVDEGVHTVREVLLHLASCPGKQKLLILDCGRIAYDPSLGIVVNEFPRLVEQLLQAPELADALGKQELWVMLPCSIFERSAVAHTRQRSVFGGAVSDALSGEADQWPQDEYVTLFELYRYVFEHNSRWFPSDSGASLTPLLMKAGKGLIAPTEAEHGGKRYRLVWLGGKQEEASEQEAEQKTEGDEPDDGESDESDEAPTATAAGGRHAEQSLALGAVGIAGAPLAWLQAPADQPATQADAESTDDEPTADPASEESSAVDSATADGDDAPATQPPEQDVEEEVDLESLEADERLLLGIRKAISTAWELRDRIEAAEGNEAACPVHFAPHAWREICATLLSYERRLYTGRTVQSDNPGDEADLASLEKLLRNTEELLQDLQMLETAVSPQGQMSEARCRTAPARRVARSLARYRTQVLIPNQARLATATPIENEIYDAAWQFDRLPFAAVVYAQWYAASSITSSGGVPLYAEIEKWLKAMLPVQKALQDLQQRPVELEEHSRVRQIIRAVNDLVAQRERIDRDLESLANTALKHVEEPFCQQQIEDLLCTPLLAAELRMRLVQALTGTVEPALAKRSSRSFPTEIQPTSQQWQRLVQRLQLEALLWRLAQPGAAAVLESQVAAVSRSVGQGATDDESLWTACRNVGQSLRKYTAGLADADAHAALQMVDPRDAADVNDMHAFCEIKIDFLQPVEIQLAGQDAIQLDRTEATRLQLTLRATQEKLLQTGVEFEATDSLVKIVELPARSPVSVRDGWFFQTVDFDVTAVKNQEEARVPDTSAAFRIRWFDPNRGDYREDAHPVRLTLPKPNRIDLEVLRFGGADFQPDDSRSVELQLYPNRRTQYQLSLLNRSGQAKKVHVTLHAIPADAAGAWRPGQISDETRRAVYDADGTQFITAPIVAKTAEPIELAADENERTLIDFSSPDAPSSSAGDEATPPATESSDDEPDVIADASRGLLCVITNADDADDRQLKWIELTPLPPREFLQATVGYDYDSRRLVARVRARDMDDDGKPDLPAGSPVEVAWNDAFQEIPDNAQKQLSGEIESSSDQLELFARIVPDNQMRTVILSVDGYPRAFRFQVPCDEQPSPNGFRAGKSVGVEWTEARINSLSVPGDGREFHYPPFADLPAVDQRDPKVEYLQAARDQAIALAAPCSQIHVTFQVDAPVDAFRDTNDQAIVTLGDDLVSPLTFYADRQMTFNLTKAGEKGLIELESIVSDYAVDLKPGGLENLLTYVEVGLRLPRLPKSPKQVDQANVILDSDDPKITGLDLLMDDGSKPPLANGRIQVPAGRRLIGRVYVKDTSGVGHALYGFLPPGKRDLDPEKASRHEPPEPWKQRGGAVLDLPIETKDVPPGLQTLQVRVTDRAKHEGEPAQQLIEIVDAQAMPQLGVIEGRIRFGAARTAINASLFELFLESPGGGKRPVTIQRDGSFLIKDLPAGEYKLQAKGSESNQDAAGDLEGVQPWKPGSKEPVSLIVTHG